jgi:hypothetical protein
MLVGIDDALFWGYIGTTAHFGKLVGKLDDEMPLS